MDLESSPTVVYIRKNIEEQQIEDMDGNLITQYVYDEAKVPQTEYAVMESEKNTANIDYIAMMTDVELPEEVI